MKASAALRQTNQRLELKVNELARSNEEIQRFGEAQKSGDFARAIVKTIHTALVVVDFECRVVTVNEASATCFEFRSRAWSASHSLAGKPASATFHACGNYSRMWLEGH